MIVKYIAGAVARAEYEHLEDGFVCATVRGLRGVIAIGRSERDARAQLSEVVEEWILVRVARGLDVPKLGGISVRVRRTG